MTNETQTESTVGPEDIKAVAEQLKQLAETLPPPQQAALLAALAIRIPPEVEGFAEPEPAALVGDDVEGYFWWLWQQPQTAYQPRIQQPMSFISNNSGTFVSNDSGSFRPRG